MIESVKGKNRLILDRNYSKISVYIHDKNKGVTDEMVKESMMNMAEPFMSIEEDESGARVFSLSVINPEHKESTDKYIKYLEETLDALGVTVHRDVKGEIYLGSKGSDPSAK